MSSVEADVGIVGARVAGSMLAAFLADAGHDVCVVDRATLRACSLGPGWALVGDAAMHQDPWTGVGMDNAGVHASFLAEAMDDWLVRRLSEASAMRSYHERRDAHALAGFHETIDLGRDFREAVWE